MEHTITGGVHRLWINGVETGEMGLSAGVAGVYNVPLTMVSSDAAGCAEASRLVPGIETAITKEGYGRYMGRVPPSNRNLAPHRGRRRAGGAARGGDRAQRYDDPTTVRVEFNRAEEADMGAKLVQNPTRVDGYTLEGTFGTYAEAHRFAWNLMAMSFEGIGTQK